jgi:hypothetical protein
MAKISHTKIKQPSFGEKRPKLTYTKISRFTVLYIKQDEKITHSLLLITSKVINVITIVYYILSSNKGIFV